MLEDRTNNSTFYAITPAAYPAGGSPLAGGIGDDGLLQRLQLAVWPDIPATWTNVDRSVYRKQWGMLRTPEDVCGALSVLESRQWVRLEAEKTGGRGGEVPAGSNASGDPLEPG
jgi:hypothetical protein